MIVRLEKKSNSFLLEAINQVNESMVFKHELPLFTIEYAKNKMLITSYPSHNYIVKDWQAVSVIPNPESANFNFFALPMPGFDEQAFPFLALCGQKNINILNINTYVHKPLIN